jgi:hypothetical protein
MPIITTPSERIGLCTRMRRFFARFSGPEASNRSPSSADFIITTSEFRFSVHTPGCFRPTSSTRLTSILCVRSFATRWTLMRYATRTVRSSFFSRRLTCELERSASLTTTRSGPTLFWPPLVYHFCSKRSKSTVSTIGMVGIWATRQSSHSSITVTAETW